MMNVLHRARTKQQLNVLEAIYILFNRPFLCKQNPKHSLHLLGDVSGVTWGGLWGGPPPLSRQHFSYHPLFTHLSFIFLTFKRPPIVLLDKSPYERTLVSFIIRYFLFNFFLFSSHLNLPVTTYDFFKYFAIQICM